MTRVFCASRLTIHPARGKNVSVNGTTRAAEPAAANALYELLCDEIAASGLTIARGRFRAMMSVNAANDGPINILLDSKKLF